jgi:hypothetical protein
MHLLRTEGADHVRVHPDGEHGKQFDFSSGQNQTLEPEPSPQISVGSADMEGSKCLILSTSWLARRQFRKIWSIGTTAYGGVYENATGQTITINPRSGLGDVVAEIGDHVISADCKGGIINTPSIPARYHDSIRAFARRSACSWRRRRRAGRWRLPP